MRGREGRDVGTDEGGGNNAGRDRMAGEEVEGQAGGQRRRAGGKRSRGERGNGCRHG